MAKVCREIFEEVCILANGDVVCSCLDADGQRPLGNINDHVIYEIFRGEKYANLREIVAGSSDGTYCPFLGCPCSSKTEAPVWEGNASKLFIKKIRLETISFCNLRCPECKIVEWEERRRNAPSHEDGKKSRPRQGQLSLDAIQRLVIDTKDTLKDLWLYNYGEPFLDRNLLDILRFVRQTAPAAWIYMHSNGNAVPDGWQEIIVREGLLDHISFSIDGATPESYKHYRVRGEFDKAFQAMTDFLKAKDDFGKQKPNVTWQYILFEWNDSDEELATAQKLAEEYGLEIVWIVTHTKGKSLRFTADSAAYQQLKGIKHYSGKLLALQNKNPAGDMMKRVARWIRKRI